MRLEERTENLFRKIKTKFLNFRARSHDDFRSGMKYLTASSHSFTPNFINKRLKKKGEGLLRKFIENNLDDERVAEAHYSLGKLYRKERGKAVEEYKKAIEKNPNYLMAHEMLVDCYKVIGDELVDYFQKAVADNPDYELGHLSLGMLYEEKREEEQAIEAYEKAHPHPLSYYRLGNLFYEQGKDEEAFNELIQARITPLQIAASEEDKWELGHFIEMQNLMLGAIIERNLDDLSFVGICERAIDSHHTNIAPYNLLAIGYRGKDMFDKAIQIYQRILELESNHTTFHREIGNTYVTMEKPDQAIQAYEKALEVERDDKFTEFTLLGMGEAYYNKKDYRKALDTWKKIHGILCSGYMIIPVEDLIKDAKEKLRKCY